MLGYEVVNIIIDSFTFFHYMKNSEAVQRSFFVVEDSSNITDLYSNKNSLIVFDEIGRGTSTFDGMSIARAVLEYVSSPKKIGAKTLFATHYHELTSLENDIPGVINYNIAVKKRGDDITFLRRIVRGPADDSYGIEVAKLAGIPDDVVKRAKVILKGLENDEGETVIAKPRAKTSEDNEQTTFMDYTSNEIVEKLKNLDVDTLTPIEAMQILYQLHQESLER